MSLKPVKKSEEKKAARKSWDKKSKLSKLPKDTTEIEKTFLIVSEGENTEVDYFESFPLVSAKVVTIGGCGSKTSLVKKAIEKSKNEEYKGFEVWCVFDFDVKYDQINQKQDYNNSIKMASQKGFKIAYSNDCFELWFVLHFKLVQAEHHREEYYKMLSDIFQEHYNSKNEISKEIFSYGKESAFSKKIYKLLETEPANQTDAYKRSLKLHEEKKELPCADQNPCTTVYELVWELNKHLKS